jgi:hypothetical protein
MKNYFNKKRDHLANILVKWMISQKKEKVWLLKICMFFYTLLMVNNEYEPEYKEGERHHYIQKFILKNFCIKIGGEIKGQIYQYEKNKETQLKSIEKEAACIKDFYSVPHIKTKKLSLMLEKRNYSFIERWGKIIIEDFVLNNNNLEPKFGNFRESQLASYVAFQYTRTPAFKSQLKNYFLFLFEKRGVSRELFSNKRKQELFDVILNNKYNISRDELVEFNMSNKFYNRDVESTIRNRLDNLNSISNLLCVVIGNHIAETIFRKKMYVLTANDPYFFVLPDSGTMIYDFSKKEYFLWPYGWDLSNKSTSIFFPISPGKCIVYTNFDLNILELKECFIKESIILAYHQKHKYIYSDRKDEYIQKNINNFPLVNNYI